MTRKKFDKEKISQKAKYIGNKCMWIGVGALGTGIAAACVLYRKNKSIEVKDMTIQCLRDGIEGLSSDFDKIYDNCMDDIQIRDCMIMEGIDNDEEIYARRMRHFVDWKTSSKESYCEKEYEELHCEEAGESAKYVFNEYLNSLGDFESEVPVISEDTELPF